MRKVAHNATDRNEEAKGAPAHGSMHRLKSRPFLQWDNWHKEKPVRIKAAILNFAGTNGKHYHERRGN